MAHPPKNQLDKLNDLSWHGSAALLRVFYENPNEKKNLLKFFIILYLFCKEIENLTTRAFKCRLNDRSGAHRCVGLAQIRLVMSIRGRFYVAKFLTIYVEHVNKFEATVAKAKHKPVYLPSVPCSPIRWLSKKVPLRKRFFATTTYPAIPYFGTKIWKAV